MKKRKSVIIITTLATLFLVASVVLYFVAYYSMATGIDLVKFFDYLVPALTNFNDVLVWLPLYGVAGLCALLSIIWVVVNIMRKRGMVALYVILFILSAGVLVCYYPYFYTRINPPSDNNVIVELVIIALALVSYLLFVVLFIVDLITGKKKAPTYQYVAPEAEEVVAQPVYEEVKDENEVKEEAKKEEKEEIVPPAEEEEEAKEENSEVADMATEPKEKKAPAKKKTAKKKAPAKAEEKKEEKPTRATQTVILTNEDGQSYAKAYHVSRRAELNKWQVKATGSKKVLKLFNTQKEAIEYAESLAKSNGASVRVHSKAGKIRKHK